MFVLFLPSEVNINLLLERDARVLTDAAVDILTRPGAGERTCHARATRCRGERATLAGPGGILILAGGGLCGCGLCGHDCGLSGRSSAI